jgi:hypothetical protein
MRVQSRDEKVIRNSFCNAKPALFPTTRALLVMDMGDAFMDNSPRAHPRGWGGGPLPDCSTQDPKPKFIKNMDFVDTIMSNVWRDLPSSRNQPLKSADD